MKLSAEQKKSTGADEDATPTQPAPARGAGRGAPEDRRPDQARRPGAAGIERERGFSP